ncbi:MAG: ketopantoate reductase family protein, partial [Candidatus Binatia bacterium]
MRTLIVGAGAVGGYFGMKLARAGSPVTFLARGETLRQLRETGLRVESDGEGSFLLSPVDAVESPAGHGPFELVFVCVKAQDTALAVGGLGAVLAPDAIVLSLQNGIESEETIERRLGIPPMLRAVAFIGAESTAPGVIRHVSGGTIVLGEPDDRPSARLERLVAVLRAATIAVRIPESIRRAKWQKLAWNASFNTIAAITGRNVAAILA